MVYKENPELPGKKDEKIFLLLIFFLSIFTSAKQAQTFKHYESQPVISISNQSREYPKFSGLIHPGSDTNRVDTAINKRKNLFNKIGFQIGGHSTNQNQNSLYLGKGLSFDLYLGIDLSDEVQIILAYSYWESQTKEMVFTDGYDGISIPPENITSNALKLGLDFTLFKVYGISLITGPSILIENINKARGGVYSLGVNLKLKMPLWYDKVNLLSTITYQMGEEFFALGGGGFDYTFVNYLAGIEVSL